MKQRAPLSFGYFDDRYDYAWGSVMSYSRSKVNHFYSYGMQRMDESVAYEILGEKVEVGGCGIIEKIMLQPMMKI